MISPLVSRYRLAEELKKVRDAAGLTHAGLRQKIGWSTAKISRLENANYPPNMAEIMKLVRELDVEPERAHKITAIAQAASERGWWADFSKHMGPRQAVAADLEWGAASIVQYQSFVIPGLLQTADYVRARGHVQAVRNETAADFDLEAAVDARLARQQMTRRPGGPQFTAIIDELVLHRPQAPLSVMRAQFHALAELAETSTSTTVRLLPIDTEFTDYWVPTSSFSIFTYPDAADPAMLLIEGQKTDTLVSEAGEVTAHQQLSQRLQEASLSREASAARFRQAAEHALQHTPPAKGPP